MGTSGSLGDPRRKLKMNATIYSTAWCGWCDRAKAFLTGKGIEFTEIDIEAEFDDPRRELMRLSGRQSVPQIFIGDVHVGGFDDLLALDRKGRLEGPAGSLLGAR